MRKKTSFVWQIDQKELQDLFDRSSTISEVCNALKINKSNGSVRTLHRRIDDDKISLEKMIENRKRISAVKKKNLDNVNVFVENSSVTRRALKRAMLAAGFVYACKDCKNNGLWNGKPLSLQIEHINGISNDNRKENICFICPNCHSQTSTYAGKNKTYKRFSKVEKIVLIEEKGARLRKFNPTKEELKSLIDKKLSWEAMGLHFKVSSNAVRKRCRLFNLIPPPKKKL